MTIQWIEDLMSDSTKRVIAGAKDEAWELNHSYLGTEHLLLAPFRFGDSDVARNALANSGLTYEAVYSMIIEIVGKGQDEKSRRRQPALTPRCKKVLEMSVDVAKYYDSELIEPEHMLLAILREGEGVAAQIIVKLGSSFERAYNELTQEMLREQVVRHVAFADIADLMRLRFEADDTVRLFYGRVEKLPSELSDDELAKFITALGAYVTSVDDTIGELEDRLASLKRHRRKVKGQHTQLKRQRIERSSAR